MTLTIAEWAMRHYELSTKASKVHDKQVRNRSHKSTPWIWHWFLERVSWV